MASLPSSFSFFFLFIVSHLKFMAESSPLVPAIYVFGDSLVDAGNNNYLNTFSKANFPHNGVDFPNQQSTGRFSNGKVVPDFLVEEVGLALLPPYLSLVDENGTIINGTSFITGVNFASGGSGILNETRIGHYKKLGFDAAKIHFSKSLFVIVVGSNDLFSYYMGDAHNDTTPQEYVDLMVSTFDKELKRLYKFGARKYVVTSVPLLGCTPSHRINIPGEGCKEELNYWGGKYNIALGSLLRRFEVELPGFSYSYADIYAITFDMIENPSSYGFTEIKAACCGLGPLNALIPCIPLASLCPNRNNHLFWDPFHPTEKVNHIVVDYIYDGSNFTYPINIKELIDKPTKSIGYQYY